MIFALILILTAATDCSMTESEVLVRARIRKSHSTSTDDGSDLPNVARVKECFSLDDWNDILTDIDAEKYSHDAFLKAVARFPAFCGGTKDECKLELAFIFGHMTQETGNGVWSSTFHFHTETEESSNGKTYTDDECGPTCDLYPPVTGKTYIGRGSKQLSWNYNYGKYSAIMAGDRDVLLKNPEKVLEADHIITSGLWFYMTPQSPKPSMHDIVLGCWAPSSSSSLKLNERFAWTTKVINGAQECSASRASDDTRHESRFNYFKKWAEHFGLTDTYPTEFEFTDCKDLGGYGNAIEEMDLYWQKDESLTSANGNCGCELTKNTTPYPRYRFDSDDAHSTGGLEFCETNSCQEKTQFTGTIESSKCRTGEKDWGTCDESKAGTSRCGMDWSDANKNCYVRCNEDAQCDGNKKCSGGLSEDACQPVDYSARCGAGWMDAYNKCGTTCGVNSDCTVPGESCYGGLSEDTCSGSFLRRTAKDAPVPVESPALPILPIVCFVSSPILAIGLLILVRKMMKPSRQADQALLAGERSDAVFSKLGLRRILMQERGTTTSDYVIHVPTSPPNTHSMRQV